MNSQLSVVMFAAEAVPFAKVGGLADVVGALPKELEKLGVKSTIVLPGYRRILEGPFDFRPCREVPSFDVQMGPARERAGVYQAKVSGSDVDVYVIACGRYFDREGIYDDPATKEGYSDNMQRFVFFMKAGLEMLLRIGHKADILHCHDSHTAMIPGLLHASYRQHQLFSHAGTLFTIHNLAHQGIYSTESLDYAGIDQSHFYSMSPFEYWGKVNFMKAGIELSDKINTVSRNYALEIRSDHEFGMGLEGVLSGRKDDLSGIVNGIDYQEWNPEKDPLIPTRFSKRDLRGKAVCKEQLLKRFGLPDIPGRRVPLVGIVSRLADQKGFDLIAEAAEQIAALDLQLVILGTGQQKYHDLFEDLAARYPGKIAVRLAFDNELAHMIEAGCDIFLMPSKFEPCGLNQLYSLRYGTIPVVRKTGGLADTVVQWDGKKGTGFCFSGYSSGEMMAALKQAVTLYSENQGRWQELMIRAMSEDWSWTRSAHEYMNLYQSIYALRQ